MVLIYGMLPETMHAAYKRLAFVRAGFQGTIVVMR